MSHSPSRDSAADRDLTLSEEQVSWLKSIAAFLDKIAGVEEVAAQDSTYAAVGLAFCDLGIPDPHATREAASQLRGIVEFWDRNPATEVRVGH